MASLSSYTFDVPDCNFVGEDDQNTDSWFDQIADAENIPEMVIHAEKPENGDGIQKEGNVGTCNARSSNRLSTPRPQARRSSKRLSARQRSQQRIRQTKDRVAQKIVAHKENQPPTKKPKLSRSDAKCQSADATINRSHPSEGSPKNFKRKLISTPNVLKRRNMPVKVKNSEEQELEKVKRLQKELVDKLKSNEESLKCALAGDQPPKKVPIRTTKPVEIHFHTDDRIKRHPEEPQSEYKQVDFTHGLRKHPPSPVHIPKGGCTVPKPFNLSRGKKRKFDESATKYVSTAQHVLAFQNRTPPRFHLRSRHKEIQGPSPIKSGKMKLTQPMTPELQTKQRHREPTCKSSAELEAEELEKLQQFKFKAQDINPKILEGCTHLPKKPPVKEPTKPIGFNLEIEKRIQQREKKDGEEETFTFHSRPCPTKILADVVGVPEKRSLPITVPQSPAFALKSRLRLPEEPKEEPAPIIKANPMPYFGLPFKPKIVEQKSVEACPFSFMTRDKQMMEQKEKKLEELRNPEVPKFKAQPLPDFDRVALPEKVVKESTIQEPFTLEIEKRGQSKLQRFNQQVEEELQKQKEMATFKARPNTVIHQAPFKPKKENRILPEGLSGSIVQESFELATEKRARERQKFERCLAEVEAQKRLLEEENCRRQEEEEKEEVARLRQEMVPKAQPIRKFRPVEVKTSDVPLTVPKTPQFSDRFKI